MEEIVRKGYDLPTVITDASLRAEIIRIRELEKYAENMYSNTSYSSRSTSTGETPLLGRMHNLNPTSQNYLRELQNKGYPLPA